jgi:hypothetical protein
VKIQEYLSIGTERRDVADERVCDGSRGAKAIPNLPRHVFEVDAASSLLDCDSDDIPL